MEQIDDTTRNRACKKLAAQGLRFDDVLGRAETAAALTACGYPISLHTLAQWATRYVGGPEFTTGHKGRALYQIGPVLVFVMSERRSLRRRPGAKFSIPLRSEVAAASAA